MPESFGIVPMKGEALVPAGTRTSLTYHQGPLLTEVQVYTIFWGSGWQQMPQNGLIQQLNDFFDFILTSSLMDQLGEYSWQEKSIHHGSRVGTKTITASNPGFVNRDGSRVVTDDQIQKALQLWISNNTVPQPNNNTLFFVYLPPNVTVNAGGGRSCGPSPNGFCGYHYSINHTIFYAVVPYVDCDNCSIGLNQPFDTLTEVSSHELCEAITDPDLTTGWNDDRLKFGEIGDICNGRATLLGGYYVQTQWSNREQACLLRTSLAVRWTDQGAPASGLGDAVGVVTVMDTPTSSQRPYIFVKGNDHHLWVNWYDGSNWHWTDQGAPSAGLGDAVGVVTVMDTPTSSQQPYVFIKDTQGSLWVNWYDGSNWHWTDQEGAPAGGLGRAVGVVTVMDTPTSSQRPYVFIEGIDHHLWVNWWNGHVWHWTSLGAPTGGLGDAVGVVTVMDTMFSQNGTNIATQRPYVFFKDTQGSLWVNWWNGYEWLRSPQGAPTGGLGDAVGVVTVMDTNTDTNILPPPQRPYVFVKDSQDNLWVNWRP